MVSESGACAPAVASPVDLEVDIVTVVRSETTLTSDCV